jgi:hypothetical protein
MPRVRVVLLVGVVLAMVAPGVAQARAELDRSFYLNGTHRLAYPGADPSRDPAPPLVLGPRVLVDTDGSRYAEVDESGRLVEAYGRGGRAFPGYAGVAPPVLVVAPRPGDPHGFAVASQVGSEASVVRVDSRGLRDLHWGTRSRVTLFGGDGYAGSVGAVADPRRAGGVLVAAVVVPLGVACILCDVVIDIARLTPAGRIDGAWGDHGVTRVTVPDSRRLQNHTVTLAARPDGSVTALLATTRPDAGHGGIHTQLRVLRVSRTGRPVPPTGTSNRLRELSRSSDALTVVPDPGRGFFLLGRGLTRIHADGRPDARFDDVRLPGLPGLRTARTTRDGVVAAGAAYEPDGRLVARLVRLTSRGRPDPRFGPRGVLSVRFRGRDLGGIDGVTEDRVGRLFVVASLVSNPESTVGREDVERVALGVARIRTRAPDLDLASTRVVVDRGGEASVRVRCRAGVSGGCGRATVAVERAGRRLGRTRTPALRAGRSRTVRLRLGAVGRRLAIRRASIDVALTPKAVATRLQETAPVLRGGRLAVG